MLVRDWKELESNKLRRSKGIYLTSWRIFGRMTGIAAAHSTAAVSYAAEPSLSFSIEAASKVFVRRRGSCLIVLAK